MGLINFLKKTNGLFRPVLVGVKQHGKPSIRALDLGIVRPPANSQYLIIIFQTVKDKSKLLR